jgi:DNA polymerase III gamma/tau subunit
VGKASGPTAKKDLKSVRDVVIMAFKKMKGECTMKEKKLWYVQAVIVLFLGLLLLLPLRAISQVLTDEQKADLQQKKEEVKKKVEEQLTPEQQEKLKAKKEEAKKKKEEAKKKAEEYKNLSPEQQEALKKQKKEELKKKEEEAKQKAEEYKNLSPEQQEAVKQQKKDEIRKKAEEKMTPEQKDKLKAIKDEYQNVTPEEKETIQKQVEKKVNNIDKLTPADKRNLQETVTNAKMRYLSLKKGELIKDENALNAYKNLNAEHQKKLLKYIFEEQANIKKLD